MVTGSGGTATANISGVLVTCTTINETIGGTISGLTGTGLVLQDNGGNNLTISASAVNFTFATQVASGSNYAVTVLTQPSGQTCTVTSGTGTVIDAPVGNVMVSCTANTANASVTVSGLLPNTELVLQNNGADNLTVSSNGTPTKFHTSIASGSPYAVTVLTQPAGATCTVGADGSGTLTGDTINVAVSCGNIIAAGESHTCALTSSGAVLCWGLNEYGQLGNGTTADSSTPVPVNGLSSGVVSIAAGYESTCALTGSGTVWCWGDNAAGQLGNGAHVQSNVPVEVLDSTGTGQLTSVAAISVGQAHACAVTVAGAALCWGDNTEGELGTGANIGSSFPVAVSGLSSGVATISAGSYFTCAVTTASDASCWGKASWGQLGNGYTTNSATPAVVMDGTGTMPLSGVVTISAAVEDACALTSSGTVLCWGANDSNQLGNPTVNLQSDLPVQVLDSTGQSMLNGVVAISGSLDKTCAVTNTGATLCWGTGNESGQLGPGKTANSATPAPVSTLSGGVAAIAAGYDHTCAVTSIQSATQSLGGQSGWPAGHRNHCEFLNTRRGSRGCGLRHLETVLKNCALGCGLSALRF